jgi:hypothetical protein
MLLRCARLVDGENDAGHVGESEPFGRHGDTPIDDERLTDAPLDFEHDDSRRN